jgi:alkylation response protein AidB-like acyl-CoA dehydrogenase
VAQRARLLPLIAAGRLCVALASMEGCPGGDADTTRARRTQDGWRVDGHKGVVLGAPEAELVILGSHGASAETGPVLLLIDPAAPGVTLRPYPLVDGRMAAELHLHDVAPEAVLAEGEDAVAALEDAVLAGALACAAEATGAMEAALERTIDHLRQRQQFGARLADQQALRHRVADMFIACQESAALGWRAALAFDEPRTGLRRMAIAAAIAQAGPASLRVCEEAIQLHGAIAITEEFPVGHYLKRAIVAERIFGGADHWLDAFCAASASGGPAPG